MNSSDKKDLKARIKSKFKTLKKFSIDSEVDYKLINKFFGCKMAKTKIDEFAKLLETRLVETPVKGNPQEISPFDREYIRTRIVLNYKSYNQFLNDNPSFSKPFISNIINGKRMRKDDRFNRLKDAVDKLNYDISRFITL